MATISTKPAYVIDASVVLKSFLNEEGAAEAQALIFLAANGELILYAPELLELEVANILSREVRRDKLARADARQAVDAFRSFLIEQVAHSGLAGPAFELALAHRQAVYDCLYLALALKLGCPLITADRRFCSGMERAFPMVLMLGPSLALL